MKHVLRPLDRVSSIKAKPGLLVAVTIVVASVLAVIGTRLGISPWATVPVAVVVALAVTQLLARGMTSPLREMTLAAQRMAQGDYSPAGARFVARRGRRARPGVQPHSSDLGDGGPAPA